MDLNKLKLNIEFLRQCIDDRQDEVLELQREVVNYPYTEYADRAKARIRQAFEEMEIDIVRLHELKSEIVELEKLMEV